MNTRNVAIVVFYDKNFTIAVQERGSHSRVGEKYGFLGGQIEVGETPSEAIARELKEEIGYIPKKLEYFLHYSYVVLEDCRFAGWTIHCDVFLSPITKKLEQAHITEGTGIVKMPLGQAIEGEGFPKNSTAFLKKLKAKIEKK